MELDTTSLPNQIATKYDIKNSSTTYKHKLTHQTIYAIFHECHTPFFKDPNQVQVALDNLENFAFPRLIQRYLEDMDLI
jgi:hypothetical protein